MTRHSDPPWSASFETPPTERVRAQLKRKDGSAVCGRPRPHGDGCRRRRRLRGFIYDSREQELEVQFRQAQKMEAVGRLRWSRARFNQSPPVIGSCTDFISAFRLCPGTPGDSRKSRKQRIGPRLSRGNCSCRRTQVLRPSTLNLNDRLASFIRCSSDCSRRQSKSAWSRRQISGGKGRPHSGRTGASGISLEREGRHAGRRRAHFQDRTFDRPRDDDAESGVRHECRDYVLLRVRDTGVGMDTDTQRKFRALLTTKEGW